MNIANGSFKKEILKEMRLFINKNYPPDRPMPAYKRRPPKYTDDELIEIAIEAKSRFMGQINGRILGNITPINYNVWNRREKVKLAINDLNNAIVNGSMFSVDESDTLYHVNIDMLVDRYKSNIPKLKENLFFIEESRVKLYEELKKMKSKPQNASGDTPTVTQLKSQLTASKLETETYRKMYENLVIITSTIGLKEMNEAKDSALDLTNNKEEIADIVNLNQYFPSDSEIRSSSNDKRDIGSFFESHRTKK